MKVRDAMERELVSVNKDATYREVVQLLDEKKITGCPVINDAGELVGIVSYNDLMRVLFPYYDSFYKSPEIYTDFNQREDKANEIAEHKVSTFMTTNVFTANADTPILQAGGLMLSHKIHRLPVLENGKLVGIVTRTRILREIFKKNFGLT
jgi:CBS domain-containing protein